MIAQEYAPLARRTLKVLPFRAHMIHMGLGIAGEFGELIDAAKKTLIYGKPFDHVNGVEETGDILWYVANLLPELEVSPLVMQRSLDRGYTQGLKVQQQVNIWEDFTIGEMLLSWNAAVARRCAELAILDPGMSPGSSGAVMYIEEFAGNVGVLCGVLGIDPSEAMAKNIAKLSNRYGEKYSDYFAMNRNLDAERSVLEGPSTRLALPDGGGIKLDGLIDGQPASEHLGDLTGNLKTDLKLVSGDHPGGSLATTQFPETKPVAPSEPTLKLDDDAPLPGGGACATDGPCEGCQ